MENTCGLIKALQLLGCTLQELRLNEALSLTLQYTLTHFMLPDYLSSSQPLFSWQPAVTLIGQWSQGAGRGVASSYHHANLEQRTELDPGDLEKLDN